MLNQKLRFEISICWGTTIFKESVDNVRYIARLPTKEKLRIVETKPVETTTGVLH